MPNTSPHTGNRQRRKLILPTGLALTAVAGGLVITTGAVFTNTTTVAGNGFTAGTVTLGTNPISDAFNVANMAPGDVVTEPITVRNEGSLQFRYALESAATGPLANALTLAVKTGVTDCTNTGFAADGTSLYAYGALGSTDGMHVFGDKTQGPDVGDRTLDPAGSEVLCAQVILPGAATDNTYQGQSATVAFNFYAEQTAHNGLSLLDPNSASAGAIFATVNPNQTSVDVSWPASSDKHVTGYNLYRTTNGGTTWQQVASVGSTVTSYTDNTASQGTTYGYAVQAVGFDGTTTSLPTAPEASATVVTPWLAPAAPTGVTAVAGSPSSATVSWTDSSSAWVTGYTVTRSTDGGTTWSTVATLGPTATTYVDNTVTQGGNYQYAVTAQGEGDTTSSRAVAASVTVPYQAPAAVTTVTATATTSAATVSWPASTGPNLTGYTVYRSSNGGSTWDTLTTTSATSYTDNTVAQGSTYLYSVIANGQGGTTSARTTALSVTVPWQAPAAPANVTVTANPSSVTVTWTASTGPSLTGYAITRSADNGVTWTRVGTVGSSTTTYTDTTVTSGATYLYSVTATGSGGNATKQSTSVTVPVPGVSQAFATVATPYTVDLVDGGDGYLYVTDEGTRGLIKVNETTGAVVTTGFANSVPALYAVTRDNNGYLYAVTSSTIYKVNQATGTVTSFANPALSLSAAITYGADGYLYVAGLSSIYKINPNSGASSVVTNAFTNSLTGITYGPDGYLYVSYPSGNSGYIYRVNPTNGAIVNSWYTGLLSPNHLVTGTDGYVYGVGYNSSDGNKYIYRLDTTTGTISTVGSHSAVLSGIAWGADGYIYTIDSTSSGNEPLLRWVP